MNQADADLRGIKEGVAMLTTVMLSCLQDVDPLAATNFKLKLELAYAKRRESASKHELEMLSWVRTLITGFDFSNGQGEAFLDELGGRAVNPIKEG